MAVRLGIVSGGGSLPVAVASEAAAGGREIFIAGLVGEAETEIEGFPHTWVKWGEIGKLVSALKAARCDEIVIIGSVSRPDMTQVRFDFGAIRNLPLILSLMVGGDDAVLSNVVRFFEAKGFNVRGAHEVAPVLVVGEGPLGRHKPGDKDRKDLQLGFSVVEALGRLDVGQSAVVTRGHVIAVEAVEGTDRMLERAAGLRQWGRDKRGKRSGVLVKCPKPGQELRVDMPAIGPKTVEGAAEAGLAGIAVAAGQVLIAERAETIAAADAAGLFISGIVREV